MVHPESQHESCQLEIRREIFGYPVEGLSLIAACFPASWEKAEVDSDVFFVERLIAIDEVGAGLPTLAFPEGIALLVAGIYKHTSLSLIHI